MRFSIFEGPWESTLDSWVFSGPLLQLCHTRWVNEPLCCGCWKYLSHRWIEAESPWEFEVPGGEKTHDSPVKTCVPEWAADKLDPLGDWSVECVEFCWIIIISLVSIWDKSVMTCCASIGTSALGFADKLVATGEKLLVVCASNSSFASAMAFSTIVMWSAWARRRTDWSFRSWRNSLLLQPSPSDSKVLVMSFPPLPRRRRGHRGKKTKKLFLFWLTSVRDKFSER